MNETPRTGFVRFLKNKKHMKEVDWSKVNGRYTEKKIKKKWSK